MSQSNIDSILKESRVFAPPEEFSRTAHIKSLEEYEQTLSRGRKRPGEILGRRWRASFTGSSRGKGARMGSALGQVVRRRPDQSLLQLPRPSRRDVARNKAAMIWEGEPGDIRTSLISNCS